MTILYYKPYLTQNISKTVKFCMQRNKQRLRTNLRAANERGRVQSTAKAQQNGSAVPLINHKRYVVNKQPARAVLSEGISRRLLSVWRYRNFWANNRSKLQCSSLTPWTFHICWSFFLSAISNLLHESSELALSAQCLKRCTLINMFFRYFGHDKSNR